MKITALTPMRGAAAALAAGVTLTGPAHADPDINTDGAFVAALEQAGISYRSADQVMAAGQAVCGLMDGGKSGIEVISYVQNNNPGLTLDNAAKFVAIAANKYCPQRLGS